MAKHITPFARSNLTSCFSSGCQMARKHEFVLAKLALHQAVVGPITHLEGILVSFDSCDHMPQCERVEC
jgi:hypothetical protein